MLTFAITRTLSATKLPSKQHRAPSGRRDTTRQIQFLVQANHRARARKQLTAQAVHFVRKRILHMLVLHVFCDRRDDEQ